MSGPGGHLSYNVDALESHVKQSGAIAKETRRTSNPRESSFSSAVEKAKMSCKP